MADKILMLTVEDREKLNELLAWWEKFRAQAVPRPSDYLDREEMSVADKYVAFTEDAIPAMSGNTPGKARVDLRRLVNGDLQHTEQQQMVHNVGGEIAANSWIEVSRDKFGDWYATPTAVGGGGGSLTVRRIWTPPTPVTNVTQLTFGEPGGAVNPGDGITITSPAAGEARVTIDFATVSSGGLLSKTTQTIGGEKTFRHTTTINSRLHCSFPPTVNNVMGIEVSSAYTGTGSFGNVYMAPPNTAFSVGHPSVIATPFLYAFGTFGVMTGLGFTMFLTGKAATSGSNYESVVVIKPAVHTQGGSDQYTGACAVMGRWAVFQPKGSVGLNQCDYWEGADGSAQQTGGLNFVGGLFVGGSIATGPVVGGTF